MPRNKAKFRQDLKEAFRAAELASTKAAISTNTLEEDTVETAAEKIAQNCAKTYSETLLPKLADIIDNYIDSLEFNVSGLSNGGGTVAGKLFIMP